MMRAIGISLLLWVIGLLLACSPAKKALVARHQPIYLEQAQAGFSDVFSFDVYATDNTLYALLAGRLATGGRNGVAYLYSENGGLSWSTPVILHQDTERAPILSKRGDDVQLAVSGQQLVAVWRRQGELPGMGPLALAISGDRGENWELVNSPAVGDEMMNQGYADIAVDSAGVFHLVWLDDREENGNSQGLRYARSEDGGRHWNADRTLFEETCTCCWNTLVASNQTLDVLFRAVEPRDMKLVRSMDGGVHWNDAGVVGAFDWQFVGCPHQGGGLAVSGHEYHAAVWTGLEGQTGLYYLKSDDLTNGWHTAVKMTGAAPGHGDIAVNQAKAVAMVWDTMSADGNAIVVRLSSDGGLVWRAPRFLAGFGSYVTHPRVVALNSDFHVFWTEKQSSGASRWMMANF